MPQPDDLLTETEMEAIESALWYAELPGGGTAIPGRGAHRNAVKEAIAAAQRNKTWEFIIQKARESQFPNNLGDWLQNLWQAPDAP